MLSAVAYLLIIIFFCTIFEFLKANNQSVAMVLVGTGLILLNFLGYAEGLAKVKPKEADNKKEGVA